METSRSCTARSTYVADVILIAVDFNRSFIERTGIENGVVAPLCAAREETGRSRRLTS